MCTGDAVEDYALSQIQMIADNEAAKGSNIRVMPDVHPGKVGPIGLTMTVKDMVILALIGIDIGCGMSLARIGKVRKDFQKLDTVIRDNIPVGSKIREKSVELSYEFDPGFLRCAAHIRKDKVMLSLGTLGGGNHFIEVDEDENGENYLIIHSGSRRLGKEVAEYYMDKGQRLLKKQGIDVPYEMTYLTGELLEDYLHDIALVQEYAELNRRIMMRTISKGMKWKILEERSCIHNYVEMLDNTRVDGNTAFSDNNTIGTEKSAGTTQDATAILRKGAISAKKGEDVIIPINMRDGVILGKGKGNPDWNYSAPHGAGRIASREVTAGSHTLSEFKAAMKGIYSSCISKDTLDEAPFAYRDIDYIKTAIEDTVEITEVLKPVFNYKGGKR